LTASCTFTQKQLPATEYGTVPSQVVIHAGITQLFRKISSGMIRQELHLLRVECYQLQGELCRRQLQKELHQLQDSFINYRISSACNRKELCQLQEELYQLHEAPLPTRRALSVAGRAPRARQRASAATVSVVQIRARSPTGKPLSATRRGPITTGTAPACNFQKGFASMGKAPSTTGLFPLGRATSYRENNDSYSKRKEFCLDQDYLSQITAAIVIATATTTAI
jgi:hypothetical protein